jgi:uncharacterized protein YbjT (DUF2867 family)
MRFAVAGGTGWIGKLVVEAAQAAGHSTSIIARSKGVDLMNGAGLAEAITGVEAVIDVSNVTTLSRKKSVAFFGAATKNLLAAEQEAGVAHHVALSIVGVDRIDSPYYAGKRRQEELIQSGSVPFTILRATQFHEFAAQLIAATKGPLVPVPKLKSQPIAAREVAEALVQLAESEPAGMAPDLAGPEVLEMPHMVRQLLEARGSHRRVVTLRIPGAVGKAMAGGGSLPLEPGPRGLETYETWLKLTEPGG